MTTDLQNCTKHSACALISAPCKLQSYSWECGLCWYDHEPVLICKYFVSILHYCLVRTNLDPAGFQGSTRKLMKWLMGSHAGF
eukprot:jgi/Botrbrau1/4347/Bobra.0232s0036.1